MLEKKIKYTDFNGTERTETFYFHISKAEMSRKEFTTDGGYSYYLQRIAEEKDPKKVYELFESIIAFSYGEKTADGKRFVKEDDNGRPLYKAFQESPAYDELIMELFDADKAAEFVKKIFPSDIVSQIDEEELKRKIEEQQ